MSVSDWQADMKNDILITSNYGYKSKNKNYQRQIKVIPRNDLMLAEAIQIYEATPYPFQIHWLLTD